MATTSSVTGVPGGPAAPGSAPPTIDNLRKRIVDAKDHWDKEAMEHQKGAVRFGKYYALLVPAAVLLLTIQILACPGLQCRTLGIILIAAELAILFLALFLLFGHIGPAPRTWARDRLRAEIVRREEFLLITRIGPYLNQKSLPSLEKTLDVRLAKINVPDTNPIDYIRLESCPSSCTWRDELDDAQPVGGAEPESCSVTTYLENRVKEQQRWYSRKSAARASTNTILENVTKLVLTAALVVAAMHLIILLACPSNLKLPIEILAIVLPPVGAAVGAIQSFLQYHRLSRTYNYYSRVLTEIVAKLTELLAKTKCQDPQAEETDRLRLEFKRLVLRTEELLAAELCHWYFFIV